eukprot:3283259-Rhodomonas_salina.2
MEHWKCTLCTEFTGPLYGDALRFATESPDLVVLKHNKIHRSYMESVPEVVPPISSFGRTRRGRRRGRMSIRLRKQLWRKDNTKNWVPGPGHYKVNDEKEIGKEKRNFQTWKTPLRETKWYLAEPILFS